MQYFNEVHENHGLHNKETILVFQVKPLRRMNQERVPTQPARKDATYSHIYVKVGTKFLFPVPEIVNLAVFRHHYECPFSRSNLNSNTEFLAPHRASQDACLDLWVNQRAQAFISAKPTYRVHGNTSIAIFEPESLRLHTDPNSM